MLTVKRLYFVIFLIRFLLVRVNPKNIIPKLIKKDYSHPELNKTRRLQDNIVYKGFSRGRRQSFDFIMNIQRPNLNGIAFN